MIAIDKFFYFFKFCSAIIKCKVLLFSMGNGVNILLSRCWKIMSRLLHSQTVLLFINISVLRDYLYESICPSNLMERPANAREIHVSAIYTMSANVVLPVFY